MIIDEELTLVTQYMKKLLLSLFVIFTFGFYAIYQRQSEPTINTSTSKLNSFIANLNFESDDDNEIKPIVSSNAPKTNQTSTSTSNPAIATQSTTKGQYKDGTYTGNVADAYYGNMQVQAVISGGKLTDINILDYPQDRSTSRYINSQALPILKQEAIQAQSAKIDTVSGASASSPAFIESLSSALALAKN